MAAVAAKIEDAKSLRPKGSDSRTAVDAKDAALLHVEMATRAVDAIGSRMRSNKSLKRALRHWNKGDAVKAAKYSLEATKEDETYAEAFQLLAITLEKLGHLHKALVTYEQAFALDPENADLVLNLGLTAWNLDMLDGAERMFRLYIEMRPDHPAGYNNLGSVLRDEGRLEDAIEILRGAIYRMPNEAMLWNTLATALAEDGRAEESLVFYAEATRLRPDYARIWHNLGYAYAHLGRLIEAKDAYNRALAHADNAFEKSETRHSRSACLMGLGELEEGFKEYEIRHAPRFRTHVLHYTKAPLWNGENLDGKRVLVVGEQGLGDEFMFATTLPDIARAVGPTGKLQIAVDPRIVALFQRSFPEAEVGTYHDGKLEGSYVRVFEWARAKGDPDYYMPMGTPLHLLRKRIEDFPRQAFLKADSGRVEEFRTRLHALGRKPVVGICWRSMVLGAKRGKYFSAIEAWRPLLSSPNVTYVNLQYGNVASELELARGKLGLTIHSFDDLNLRDDLDGGAALTSLCDVVISAPTAAAALAGALGIETWFVLACRGWPQLGTDHYPWYRASRVFAPEKFADWDTLMPQARQALEEFAAGKVRS